MAWVTRHLATEYDGDGAVVELGTWVGDISRAIGDGLCRNPDATVGRTVAQVYDLFVFDDIEQRIAEMPLAGAARNGDSFLDLHAQRTASRSSQIEAHPGDILDQTWPTDRPIAFLFNDLSKTWDIWDHVRATFYRSLQLGATVVEQDWAHACTPWLHIWHHRYRDHFETLGQIPASCGVAFRLVRPLPDEAFDPVRLDAYPECEVGAAFDWAAELIDEVRRAHVRGAHVHLYSLHGDLDRAAEICVQEMKAGPIEGELLTIALPELARRLDARRCSVGLDPAR
jgi:hypothetical protein